ncbi:MAG: DUF5711 family protein [Oscillospiraceae bacterium]|nr:DUF5711 family protein [Oscillospiraceae bacterium]
MFGQTSKKRRIQQVPQTEDVHALRKQKKRKRHLRRAGIFACLVVLLLILYQRREIWLPRLEEMSFTRQTITQNDGTFSDGNFPLSIYGGAAYQTATIDNLLLILSDSYLYMYQTDGVLLSRRQHAYGSAMLQAAGSYALIYESGGTHFRLEGSGKTFYEKSVSDPIVFGRVSDMGFTALVTGSETSACKLIVFNKKGKQIYSRSCVEKLSEVSFRSDSGGCYAVSMHTDSGTMKSVVHHFDFAEKGEKWTSQPLDTLCISVYNTKGDDVFVLGDTCCAYLSLAGATMSTYTYPDTLVCGDSKNGSAVVVLRNEEKRTNSVVLMNGDANSPKVLEFDGEIKCASVGGSGDFVTLQTRDSVRSYWMTGGASAKAGISDMYDKFVRIGDYLFLMGYDRIDRLEYAG